MVRNILVNIGSDNSLLHQAMTWTNVDISSVRPTDNRLREFSQRIAQPSIAEIILKVTFLECNSNLQGVDEDREWESPYIKRRFCVVSGPCFLYYRVCF